MEEQQKSLYREKHVIVENWMIWERLETYTEKCHIVGLEAAPTGGRLLYPGDVFYLCYLITWKDGLSDE